MKFKDLKEHDFEYLKLMFFDQSYTHSEKMDILTEKYSVSERSIRRWWREELKLSRSYTNLPKQLTKAQEREVEDCDVILFTSAQNKTGINRQMLRNMEAYSNFLTKKGLKIQIVIAPTRYRNPTSPQEDLSKEEWWVDEVDDYLFYNDIYFKDVLLCPNIRVRPTAVNPLNGFDLLANNKSVVLPHSKIHLKSLPRFKGEKLRTLSTTGYITVKNYSDSKAGYKAKEHHSYGFVVIEKKNDLECFTPRNVKVKSDGSFTDIVFSVKDGMVSEVGGVDGFILGDIHTSELNVDFFNTTVDIIKHVKPKNIVLHDVFDGSSINPHEEKDLFIKKEKIRTGKNKLADEIELSKDLIKLLTQYGDVSVVSSNHDVFLDRHINNFDWKKDLHNSEDYLELALVQQKKDLNKFGTIFGYIISDINNCKYIKYGDSLRINNYECGLHGEHGINGARGNYKSFANLNFKMIIGHSHSPAIYDSVMVVGVTCNKDQYYNRKGVSSWGYAHAVVHENGKNQLWIFDDDYKFTNII